MKLNFPSRRSFSIALATVFALLLVAVRAPSQDTPKPKEFSKAVIDLGMVVRDIDKSAKFYTDVIGFTEAKGFSVTGDLGRKIGLIDGHPVDIRVFVLGEGDLATRLKIMSFPQVAGKAPDQGFIHSTFGFRYLTIFVTSTDRAMERLRKANVKPIGETPLEIGTGTRLTTVRDPDGNFIELIGP
jgi:catechol 2,3-dioxygenase-like lactoylglutathione lyase family enzyme